jgi:O-antigen ligase
VPIIPHLIEGYLIPLLLYWVARRAAIRAGDVQLLYGLLGVFGIYLALTAYLEMMGAWGLVFPRYIADPELGIHFGRARGPFLQSVRLGIFLLVGLAALWIMCVWRQRYGRVGTLGGLGAAVVFGGALFLTFTRSVWLGAALAALLTAWLTLQGRFRKVALVGMLACGVLLVAWKYDGLVSLKRESGEVETRRSTEMRTVFTYVSWLMFKDRPLTGFGFGQFPRANLPYLNDRETHLQMETIRGFIHHNTFLSVLVELGLVALVMYVVVLCSWGQRAWLLWQDHGAPDWMRGQALFFLIVLVVFVVQAAFHDMTYSPMENGVLFAMAGLMSGMCTMRGISALPRGLSTRRRRKSDLVRQPLAGGSC